MRISKPLPGTTGNRAMFVSPTEFIILKASVGGIADLIEHCPEMFEGHPRLVALIDIAKKMYDEMMESTRRDHLSVQDETLPAPGEGDTIHLPTVA